MSRQNFISCIMYIVVTSFMNNVVAELPARTAAMRRVRLCKLFQAKTHLETKTNDKRTVLQGKHVKMIPQDLFYLVKL